MLATIVALALFAPQTVSLVPKDTVWVYANASTPADGTYLRAWGTEGKSCPAEGDDLGEFSYSFLKWDLSGIPADAKITSAKLELANIPDPGYSLETAKKSPLEARAISGEFDAKTWTFDLASKVKPIPGKLGLLGTGYPTEITAGAPVKITIDLLKLEGDFQKSLKLALASPSHQIFIALTSALDPSVDGRTCVYKVYGQNESKESLRPKLTLVFEQATGERGIYSAQGSRNSFRRSPAPTEGQPTKSRLTTENMRAITSAFREKEDCSPKEISA